MDQIIHSPITANHLKPAECDSLILQNIVIGSGPFNGTNENDLILGGLTPDDINGVGGADCILGGSGNDYLINGSGAGSQNVLDQFNVVSYDNNDGTQYWTSSWQEIGETDGPTFGDVNIEVSQARGVYIPYSSQDSFIDQRNPNRNYGSEVELKVRGQAGDINQALFRFDLSSIPAGSNISSATIYFYATHKIPSPVYLHRITNNWTETGVTWNNFANGYDSTPIGSLVPYANFQVYSVSITNLVQQWVNGTIANQGVVLIASNDALESRFNSKEAAGTALDPYIVVEVSQGGGANNAYPDQDTYLWERAPTTNYGTATDMRVKPNPNDQKRAMLRFDLSMIPAGSIVQSATANFFATQGNSNPVFVHQVTMDWTEMGANWSNSANAYNPTPIGSFIPTTNNQYYSINVTSLLQQWVNNEVPNRGLMLIASPAASETRYATREQSGTAQDPYISITLAPGGSSQALRIQNPLKGALRQADLSASFSAQLQIGYLRQSFDDANDYVSLAISPDGGVSWFELTRFAGQATDTQFQTFSADISSFLSSTTQIRLLSSDTLAADDRIYFDNIEIVYLTGDQIGGASILIGGAGDDVFDGAGSATCYGGDGTDIFLNCLTVFDP